MYHNIALNKRAYPVYGRAANLKLERFGLGKFQRNKNNGT